MFKMVLVGSGSVSFDTDLDPDSRSRLFLIRIWIRIQWNDTNPRIRIQIRHTVMLLPTFTIKCKKIVNLFSLKENPDSNEIWSVTLLS